MHSRAAAESPAHQRPTVIVLGDMRDLYHHGCDAVISQLLDGLQRRNITPDAVLPGLDWTQHTDTCPAADLVIINGEGALHHARPVVDSVLQLAEQRRAAGRPTALINASWFANTPEQTRRLAAFDLVALREAASRAHIAAFGINSLDTPDLAIRQAIQFNDSLDDARSKANGTPAVSDSTHTDITRRLQTLASRRDWRYLPVLYPPTGERRGSKARKIERKCAIARRLGPLGRVFLSPRYRAHLAGVAGLRSYCSAIAESSGIVTGRFHAACFAIGLRKPIVAIASNTPKIESLMAEAGLDVAARTVTLDELDDLTAVPPFSAAERAAVNDYCERAVVQFDTLFDRLRTLIDQSKSNRNEEPSA